MHCGICLFLREVCLCSWFDSHYYGFFVVDLMKEVNVDRDGFGRLVVTTSTHKFNQDYCLESHGHPSGS